MIDAAPIVQLLLTVQFGRPLTTLSIFDYSDLRAAFPEYPIHQQLARGGPMPVFQPQITVTEIQSSLPRLQFLTTDLVWSLMFQEDRVSVGWNRTSPLQENSGYPGFRAVLDRLRLEHDRLVRHLRSRGHEVQDATIGEVAYSDAFYLNGPEGKRRIEDIFTNVRSIDDFRFSMLNLTYTRVLEEEYPSHVETNIVGPGMLPTGEPVMTLGTTVRFEAQGEDEFAGRFDKAHEAAQAVFQTLVKAPAFAI